MGTAYDANGNITAITPPGRPRHGFRYTPVDLEEQYTPPGLTGITNPTTQYAYNLDKQLTRVARPDGRTLELAYDPGGRLAALTPSAAGGGAGAGALTVGYHTTTGQPRSINSDRGVTLAYTHDGFLPTSETWSGPVAGTVNRTYTNDFTVLGLSVNGADIRFAYDADGLLTQAGTLALTRDSQNGFLTGTTLATTTTAQRYNGFGEPSRFTANQGATPVFDVQYTRDKLGRITQQTDTIAGAGTTTSYTYDQAGRLTAATRNGATVSYAYDANGNRLRQTTPTGTVSGVYDDQDRLLTYGNNTYAYTANGELRTKTNGPRTTTYTYDVFGNLTHVTLPNGTTVEYIIDGSNRRIGKRVNGTLTQAFLYQDQLRPIAELDRAGNVVSRFVYADKLNVPAYLIKGGQTYRIISDHLGSPRLIVNAQTGEIAQRLDYDEFGNVTADSNPGFQPFGFAGGLYDRDTKLTRFGARDYDAETGRWTAKDPIRFSGGDTNLYGYVLGDPVNFVDPDGLRVKAIVDAIKAGANKAKEVFDDINIDGPKGTRVCQVRYKKQPVARLDYGPYEGTHGEPRLHGHLPKIFPDKHIPLDPRSFFD